MRQAIPSSGRSAARPVTVPAPIGGWNTDSVASMSVRDAVYLDNFFPRTSDIQLRPGFKTAAKTKDGDNIRSLMGYKSTTGVAKLFAASQTGIYDITAGTSIVPVTACTDARWEFTNVTTAGGSFMLCCNAVDKMKLYNGAAWTDLDAASTPAITGITTSNVANISKFKTRVILCLKDSLSFYYLPNNAIAGAATEYPLGALFQKGGYLMATTTWTLDGGNGPDDYFVAITSEGEVAVFKGTDPSSSASFALVGIFQLAAPIGRRCFAKLADDTAVLTKSAVYPLSKCLTTGDAFKNVALSRKIQRVYTEFTQAHSDLFGWQISLFPEAGLLLVNVPILTYPLRNITYSYQFVMNVTTGAWCRFTGQHSEAWLAFNGKLYFALRNIVSEAWTGTSDNGTAIVGSCKTAFNPLGSGGNKHITMVRPILQADSAVAVQLGIDTDYADNTRLSSVISYSQALSHWDTSKWNVATWNGGSTTICKWRSANSRIGRTAALRLRVSAKDVSMLWISADLLVEDGGLM